MHDIIFENQEDLDDESLIRYAAELNWTCKNEIPISKAEFMEKVEMILKVDRSGVNGTLLFFIMEKSIL